MEVRALRIIGGKNKVPHWFLEPLSFNPAFMATSSDAVGAAERQFALTHGADFQGRMTYRLENYIEQMEEFKRKTQAADYKDREWTTKDETTLIQLKSLEKINRRGVEITGFPLVRAVPQAHVGLGGAALIDPPETEGHEWEIDIRTGQKKSVPLVQVDPPVKDARDELLLRRAKTMLENYVESKMPVASTDPSSAATATVV